MVATLAKQRKRSLASEHHWGVQPADWAAKVEQDRAGIGKDLGDAANRCSRGALAGGSAVSECRDRVC